MDYIKWIFIAAAIAAFIWLFVALTGCGDGYTQDETTRNTQPGVPYEDVKK